MNIKEDLRRELEEEYGLDANSISTSEDFESLLSEDNTEYSRGGSRKKKNKGS